MDLQLRIRSAELDDERIQDSTFELRQLLNTHTDAAATLPEAVATPGSKGDPVTLGTLALAMLTSGAGVAVFKVLEAYVSRKRSIELEVSRPDGRKLVLRAQETRPEQLAALQKTFEDFLN